MKLTIAVYDNGKTFDHYTLVITIGKVKEFYGLSDNPLDANGFNIFCGTNKDGYAENKQLGKLVALDSLPDQVRLAICMRAFP